MSSLYPDLPLSSFPNNIDSFMTWLNIIASDGILIKQYQEALESGNTTLANQILSQIPSGSQKIIKANDLNKITQAILAVERFYKTDIEPYVDQKQTEWLSIINQFSYQGIWSSGTSYDTNNIVSYTVNGLNLLFLAILTPPVGTNPTNSQYWRLLTIQGQQGISGEGLSYRQEWSPSVQYEINDAISYNNAIWMALKTSTNIEPTTSSDSWKKVMDLELASYPIQPDEPQGLNQGDLWFNTSDNPTEYYYLQTLTNPVTQEMIPVGYQAYGVEGVVLNGNGPLPISSGGTNAIDVQNALHNIGSRPNQNIAKNPNFKINQRNFSSDNWTSGYGPDGWISVGDGHLEYSGGAVKTVNQYLLQRYELGEIDAGVYTISAICTGNISGDLGFWGGQTAKYTSINYENGLASATVEITPEMVDPIKNGYLYILCQNNGTISRVKVEKSQNQTLAYKKADGNWEPIDSEEYEEELAVCQRQLLDFTPNIAYNDSFIGECGQNYASFCIPTPVTMRAVPVFIGDLSNIQIAASNGAFPSPTEVRVVLYGANFVNIRCIVTDGNLNTGMTCNLRVKNSESKLLLSAEP